MVFACPITKFEDHSSDPRRIEGLAKDQPISVTHKLSWESCSCPLELSGAQCEPSA